MRKHQINKIFQEILFLLHTSTQKNDCNSSVHFQSLGADYNIGIHPAVHQSELLEEVAQLYLNNVRIINDFYHH